MAPNSRGNFHPLQRTGCLKMKTYSAKAGDVQRNWLIIDAEGLVLGRLASQISMLIRGKHKPMFTPSMNCGDCVVVINADKIHLTGTKYEDKKYYKHTGHPGGIKETNPRKVLEGRFPVRILEKAVQRMVSREPLGRACLKNMYLYAGSEHPHAGQQPQVLDFGKQNRKNRKAGSDASAA